MAEQCVVLEHKTNAALPRRQVVDPLARNEDIPAVGMLEACNHAQDGGLATARRSQEADKFSLFHRQIHVI